MAALLRSLYRSSSSLRVSSSYISVPFILPPSSSYILSPYSTRSLRKCIHRYFATSSTSDSNSSKVTNHKQTTGLTGVPVVPNAREVLLSLYEETRSKALSYEQVPYNQHIIRLCDYRYKIVSENESVESIELKLSCGQIEELIEQAENEYDLLIAMNEEYRPWLPDIDGDALFKTYHPSFGQSEKDQLWQTWCPDDDIWEEVDQELGLKTKNTMTEEQWQQYITTTEGKLIADITDAYKPWKQRYETISASSGSGNDTTISGNATPTPDKPASQATTR